MSDISPPLSGGSKLNNSGIFVESGIFYHSVVLFIVGRQLKREVSQWKRDDMIDREE